MDGIFGEFGAVDLVARLGAATLLGGLLGLERELRGRAAGLRTNAIVSLSSATITVSALMLFYELRAPGIQPDPLRVVQGLAQAIGFIVAGLVFVRGGDVKNLTTAANLWLVTAVGIACGMGQWKLVAVAVSLGFILLTVVRLAKPWLGPEEEED